jgi:5-methylcytosine-specific restriction endonuclease McrA
MSYKEQILKLKQEHPGYGYRTIAKIIGCNWANVRFHLNISYKQRQIERIKGYRRRGPISNKLRAYHGRLPYDKLRKRKDAFSRIKPNRTAATPQFTIKELLEKLGEKPTCYLTGRPIDLQQPETYAFDHIHPVSKGGSNHISNLGLTCKVANIAKTNMMLDEFLTLCQEILKNHGYQISKLAASIGIAPNGY